VQENLLVGMVGSFLILLRGEICMELNNREMASSLNLSNLMSIQRGTLNYTWRDIECLKNPFDFALLFKLLWELKPRTIVEIGSCNGGSALLMADIIKLYGFDCHIWSVDHDPKINFDDDRITFLKGDANDLSTAFSLEELPSLPQPWLVLEDSAHLYETTLSVLKFFDGFLMKGDYVIVEDGNVDDMGRSAEFHGGPNRAIKEFFENRLTNYTLDTNYCDYWGHNMTWNTNGYWRRVL
jgi:cephalosporin hydroxylase